MRPEKSSLPFWFKVIPKVGWVVKWGGLYSSIHVHLRMKSLSPISTEWFVS